MHKVKVVPGALFGVGQGSLVELATDQAAARQHKLDAMATLEARHDGFTVYRAKDNIEFKGGEVLAVSEIDKGQSHIVEVLEPAPAGEGVDTLEQGRKDDERGFNTPRRPHGRRNG